MIAFHLAGIAVSGTLVTVASKDARGVGPCRLYVKNTGSQALTAARVLMGPDVDHVSTVDVGSFASLTPGEMSSLALAAPVSGLVLLATCVAGTTLDVWLDNAVGIGGA